MRKSSVKGFGGGPSKKPPKLGTGKSTLKGDAHGSPKTCIGKTMK